MKKIVMMVGVIAAALGALADTWTDPKTGITWTYTVSDGQAGVRSGSGSPAVPISTIGAITIPSTLGDCPVVSIGYSAFSGCNGLTSITIPEGVTSIGDAAFCDCSGLTSVTIPSSVVSIGEMAFARCDGLKSVDFEGTSPSGLSSAAINTDAAIRYNVAYDDQWLPVIQSCGFMNATPYTPPKKDGGPYTEVVDGIELTFMVKNGEASVGYNVYGDTAIPSTTTGAIAIPSVLGGCQVTSVGAYAFDNCGGLTSVTIPEGVTNIGDFAFCYCSGLTIMTIPSRVTSIGQSAFKFCSGLTSVTIPSSVTSIGGAAFLGCTGLTSVTIPSSVTRIGTSAFSSCSGLTNVVFECEEQPSTGSGLFDGTPADLCVVVNWGEKKLWQDRPVVYAAESGLKNINVNMTVTNIVVHYIQTSEQSPMTVPISDDVGFVNVVTEIKGGKVSVPDSWAANYAGFEAKFGSDFGEALTTKSGKYDAAKNPMFVWQDYVAGTDPTDETSVFRASVTMVDNVPVISYTPQLSEAEAAKRTYTIWGKEKLQDQKWVVVPSGNEAKYNFFKVTVEMK